MVRDVLQRGATELDIPLFEHSEDGDRNAMSRMIRTFDDEPVPTRFVLSFMRDAIERYVEDARLSPIAMIRSETCDLPLYSRLMDGREIGMVQVPVGAPAASMLFDLLIASGVRIAIACGGCGVLEPLASGRILVPESALRDEGTSYHYAPPARWISLEGAATEAVRATLASHHVPYDNARVWTTDGFFRETPRMISLRRSEGCSAVDMECAALAAVAKFYGVEFAEILYSGDRLERDGSHDERAWLHDREARDIAFLMAMSACASVGSGSGRSDGPWK